MKSVKIGLGGPSVNMLRNRRFLHVRNDCCRFKQTDGMFASLTAQPNFEHASIPQMNMWFACKPPLNRVVEYSAFKDNVHEELYNRPFLIAVDTADNLRTLMEEICRYLLPLTDNALANYLRDKSNAVFKGEVEKFSTWLVASSRCNNKKLRKKALYRRYLTNRDAADLHAIRGGRTNLEIFTHVYHLDQLETESRITGLEKRLLTQ